MRTLTLTAAAVLLFTACGGAPPSNQASATTASLQPAGAAQATTPVVGGAAAATQPGDATPAVSTLPASAGAPTVPPKGANAAPSSPSAAAKPKSGAVVAFKGGFGNVDTCKLVQGAEAKAALAEAQGVTDLNSAIVHTQVLDAVDERSGTFSQTCMYTFALQKDGVDVPTDQGGKGGAMLVEFVPTGGVNWLARNKENGSKSVSGVGDQAWTTGPAIVVLKGDMGLQIAITFVRNLMQPIPPDRYNALAQQAVGRMGGQASGPAPAPPKFVPGQTPPTMVPAVAAAPAAAAPAATAAPNPKVTALTASIQASLVAAQAGDLDKAKATFKSVDAQWAAIPNDGKLVTPDLYANVTTAITHVDEVLASGDTDAPAAAAALGDLNDSISTLIEAAPALSAAATMMPQLAADMATAVAAPTPIMLEAGQNPACALITTAEASATLGKDPTALSLPTSNDLRFCNYVSAMSATATPAPLAVNVLHPGIGIIQIELHPTGGAQWYGENIQRFNGNGYRSGSDIGDQFFAFNAQTIWVLKGDKSFSITMPVFLDFPGTPIDAMKSLATKAAGRL